MVICMVFVKMIFGEGLCQIKIYIHYKLLNHFVQQQ